MLQKKLIAIIFVAFLLFISFFAYLKNVVNPIAQSYGEAEVKRMLVKSSNNAILNISTIKYDDIITIKYSDDAISSIVANTVVINTIANSLAIETQKEIELNSSLGVKIPIGTLSGITFLIGKGHNISFAINPLGSVTCSFYTTFTDAGINQTSHKIYVIISSQANLIMPFSTKNISSSIEYLISECLIIGKVPSTYVNVSSLNDLK